MPMPKYEPAGIRIAGMPQITTVGMQEAARTAQTLSQAMDRVSGFALRQAETQAQIEGAEYGATNAPTHQQLQDAIEAGRDPLELLPGDKTTVFGRAARNTALDEVSTAMELHTGKLVTELQGKFANEEITLNDLGTQLETLVKSQTDVMRRISPVAATKFSAAVGVTANSAYLAAAKDQAKRNAADQEIMYRSGVDTLVRGAETVVRAGPTIAADGTVVTIDDKLNVYRDRISSMAQDLNDVEFYQTKMNEFDKAVTAAKIGVVMDEAMFNPDNAMNVIRGTSKFKDPEIQAVFESMDNEDVRSLYKEIQSSLSTKLSLESANDAKIERLRGNLSKDIQGNITAALLDGNQEEALKQLDDLRLVDPVAYASKAMTVTTQPGIDDPATITMLRRKSLNNILTAGDIDTAYQAGNMTLSTYKELTSDLENQRNQAYTKAIDWLKLDRGLPAGTLINFTAVQREADREVADIKKDLIDALNKDPALDPMAFVKTRVEDLVKTKGDSANRALRTQAESLLDELRIGTKNPNLTAQQALDLLQTDPNKYPNPQKRDNAIKNLLPVLIKIEGQ